MKKNYLLSAAVTLALLAGALSRLATAGETDASTIAGEAKISREQAEKIALGRVPGGTIKEVELEKERGKLVWSFDIAASNSGEVLDVEIDAQTGEVLKIEKD